MSGLRGDKWIREQAAKGMIEPFEAKQVRFAGGHPAISFGVSSCTRDWRITTLIMSAAPEIASMTIERLTFLDRPNTSVARP